MGEMEVGARVARRESSWILAVTLDVVVVVLLCVVSFAGLLGACLAVGIPAMPPREALDDGYYQLRDGRRLVFHSREEMDRLRPENPEEIERFVLGMRNEIGAFGIAALGAIPVAMLGWTSWKERRRLLDLLLPDARSLGAGIFGGAVLLGLNWLMSRWISSAPATVPMTAAMPPALTGVFLVLLAPVAEESWFRGRLLEIIENGAGRRLAVVVTSALFALVHLGGGLDQLPWLAVYFVFGLVLAGLRLATGGLAAGIVAHAINNAAALISTYLSLGY